MKNSLIVTFIALFFALVQPLSAQEQSGDTIRKFHLGFVYPISSNGTKAGEYTNQFSLHAISGLSKNETGLALTGLASIVKENASGAQISGVLNYAGNTSKGIQISGFANVTAREAEGLQLAGFMNKAQESNSQISGFINMATEVKGIQIAGFTNITAHEVNGLQIAGFLNKGEDVNAQIGGFLNVARKVKGVQLAGFMNIAEESDYPIGVINLIKNGEKSLGVQIDETQTTMAMFRSGGRILYGILGVGYHLGNKKDDFYAVEAGFGANIPVSNQFRIRGEIAHQSMTNFDGASYHKGIVRLLPALKLGRVELYGGPSLNIAYYETETKFDYFGKKTLWNKYADDDWASLHLGYTTGIQFHF